MRGRLVGKCICATCFLLACCIRICRTGGTIQPYSNLQKKQDQSIKSQYQPKHTICRRSQNGGTSLIFFCSTPTNDSFREFSRKRRRTPSLVVRIAGSLGLLLKEFTQGESEFTRCCEWVFLGCWLACYLWCRGRRPRTTLRRVAS